MKRQTLAGLIILAVIIISTAAAGRCDYVREERSPTEVVSDFYSFMSVGRADFMHKSLFNDSRREYESEKYPEKYRTLRQFFQISRQVGKKKAKVLIETLSQKARGKDDLNCEVKVDYRIKFTDRKTKKSEKVSGKHVFHLIKNNDDWLITNIEEQEEGDSDKLNLTNLLEKIPGNWVK